MIYIDKIWFTPVRIFVKINLFYAKLDPQYINDMYVEGDVLIRGSSCTIWVLYEPFWSRGSACNPATEDQTQITTLIQHLICQYYHYYHKMAFKKKNKNTCLIHHKKNTQYKYFINKMNGVRIPS